MVLTQFSDLWVSEWVGFFVCGSGDWEEVVNPHPRICFPEGDRIDHIQAHDFGGEGESNLQSR